MFLTHPMQVGSSGLNAVIITMDTARMMERAIQDNWSSSGRAVTDLGIPEWPVGLGDCQENDHGQSTHLSCLVTDGD